MHVPKTAGTTVRVLVQKAFRPKQLCLVYPVAVKTSRSDRVDLKTAMRWTSSHWTQYDLIYGHFQFGQFGTSVQNADHMCFLRDPEARIVSWINHVTRKPDSPYFGKLGRKSRISDLIETHRIRELDNGMVRAIGGFGMTDFGKLGNEHLQIALRNVATFRFVGFVDEMDDSLGRLSRVLNLRPQQSQRANTNPDGPAEESMSHRLRHELKNFCNLDRVLFEFAKLRFNKTSKAGAALVDGAVNDRLPFSKPLPIF